jgi:hypothetical protein
MDDMVPYTPTSTPVMGQAGSTLGGGMNSPLNLTPSPMGSPDPGTTNTQNANAIAQALKQVASSMPQQKAPMSPSQYGVTMGQTPAPQIPNIPNPVNPAFANSLQAQYPGIAQHVSRVTTR